MAGLSIRSDVRELNPALVAGERSVYQLEDARGGVVRIGVVGLVEHEDLAVPVQETPRVVAEDVATFRRIYSVA